jgi:hypothetical protein
MLPNSRTSAHVRKKLFSLRELRNTLAAVLAELPGKEKYETGIDFARRAALSRVLRLTSLRLIVARRKAELVTPVKPLAKPYAIIEEPVVIRRAATMPDPGIDLLKSIFKLHTLIEGMQRRGHDTARKGTTWLSLSQ